MDVAVALRSLPRPTDEQYHEFVKHIGNAHSWYKHLPLLTGGQFVVWRFSNVCDNASYALRPAIDLRGEFDFRPPPSPRAR